MKGISWCLLVRVVTIAYRSDIHKETPHIAVGRPVGSVVKLFNIKDTSMILEMERVRDLARRVLNGEGNNSKSEVCVVSKPNIEGELGRDELVYTMQPSPSHPHKTSLKGKEYKSKSEVCLLYTSPSPRDRQKSRMPSSA